MAIDETPLDLVRELRRTTQLELDAIDLAFTISELVEDHFYGRARELLPVLGHLLQQCMAQKDKDPA